MKTKNARDKYRSEILHCRVRAETKHAVEFWSAKDFRDETAFVVAAVELAFARVK